MSQQKRRRLRLEALENRQMLAADVVFLAPPDATDASPLQVDLGEGYFFLGMQEPVLPLGSTQRGDSGVAKAIVERQTRDGSQVFLISVGSGEDIQTAVRKSIGRRSRPGVGLPPAEGEAAPNHPAHPLAPEHRAPEHRQPDHSQAGPTAQLQPPARVATVALPIGPLANTGVSNRSLGVSALESPTAEPPASTTPRSAPSRSAAAIPIAGAPQSTGFLASQVSRNASIFESPRRETLFSTASVRAPRSETQDGYHRLDSTRTSQTNHSDQESRGDTDWDSFFGSPETQDRTVRANSDHAEKNQAHTSERARQVDLALSMMAIAAPAFGSDVALSQEIVASGDAGQAWTQRYGLTDVALVDWASVPGTEWIAVSQSEYSPSTSTFDEAPLEEASDSQLSVWQPLATKAGIALAALAAVARQRRVQDASSGQSVNSSITSALRRKRPR